MHNFATSALGAAARPREPAQRLRAWRKESQAQIHSPDAGLPKKREQVLQPSHQAYPFGLLLCQRQWSAHIASSDRVAFQPISLAA